ncbi:amidohydrolase [Mycobacterium sp. ACS4331]|uniref:amidohydrolase n=1 Tax=Mycobacterium sp. ACS4331 TaxID=1834121 RepID=UPI0007FC451C|nr:amidohydrolase [Mycobacterium sp. ACS4331]OBF25529.1 amidohydrolase [Mycobacterium sp. ACS4331]
MTADVILLGKVFTADPARPWAQGVAVRAGTITSIGTREEVLQHRTPRTEVIDAAGLISPAFHDAHIHLLEGSLFDLWVNLHDVAPGDYEPAIAAAANTLPPDAWVRGGGWNMSAFPGASPSHTTLDAVVGGRPAYLTARDGHSAWVSSAALRIAGIDATTPDPAGGVIDRDAGGNPSGTVHETAMNLVKRHLPEITGDEWAGALRIGERHLHSLGVVSWQDARLSTPMLRAYVEAEAAGTLSSRVVAAMHWDPDRGVEQVAGLLEARELAGGPLVQATMVKIFVDGVVENLTAALHEPYSCAHSHGKALFDDAALRAAVRTCAEAGFSVHVHSIGDAATTSALDAFEAAHHLSDGLRHQICHLQVIRESDIPRFHQLGVIANAQALWACRDEQNVALCQPALGTARFERQYPFGDLARAGARLAFGSDWRVSTPNPLPQMEVAITRRPPGDTTTGPLGPSQALDLQTCLLGFTREAAYAAGLDAVTGALTVGRAADIVVLDSDVFGLPPHELSSAQVDLTMFAGKVVYTRA